MKLKATHKIVYILFVMATTTSYTIAANVDSEKLNKMLMETTSQDCRQFIQDAKIGDQPVVEYNAKQVMASFLRYYFSPWDNPKQFFNVNKLKERQIKNFQKRLQKPGWGINKSPIGADVINAVGDNMDFAEFPNGKQTAIVVRKTHLRTIACGTTSFTEGLGPGEGYPFDNWQESLLHVNEPVYVLHTSKDQAWNFVITNSYICGWVLRADLAYTTPEFMAQWRASGQYITPLCDQIAVDNNISAPLADIGQLIPLALKQDNTSSHQVLSVFVDEKGYAAIRPSTIDKKIAATMPLLATPNNMAQLANQLMEQPYGWGGLEGYRDCSALVKDICFPFGIWMPRDSGPQSKAGTSISLEDLSSAKKAQLITKQGVPFFSLLWIPGHVVVYIGCRNKEVYVYNNVWGLRTQSASGQEGRAVLGRTVIMPATLGKQYDNIPQTLLDKFQRLILLTDRLTDPGQELELFKK